ncbi:hypothetical protein EDD22DRAFT_955888 [Suillus occidentalis]|nr:hypothetical protein EDD22DRAFT_955888 [Suillus occidentalis]
MSFSIPSFIEAISFSSIVINHAASTAPKELTTIHEGTPEFKEAVRSMAEECLLFRYHDIYYNIPVKDGQLVFYVTRGSHIGVVAGWENALNCDFGINKPEYHEVESVVVGEQLVRKAIEEGKVEMVDPWVSCN